MTAGYEKLVTHSDAFGVLLRDAEQDRLSHAYLLDSCDRLAAKLITDAIVRFVLGNGAGLADAVRIPGGDKETLAVADIDALVGGLYKRPSKGDKRFYLIDYAETMSPLVQNKLLKTLEEPPASVCIILSCCAVYKLLPTIVSRCRRLEVMPFSNADIRAAFETVYGDTEQVALAVALCRGSLTDADSFMRDEKRQMRFRSALEILTNLKSSKDVLGTVSCLSNQKDNLDETITFFELILRDALVWQTGLTELIHLQGLDSEIAEIAGLYSSSATEKILPFLGKIRRRLQLNANKSSLLDELIFTIVEYRVRYR